MSGVLAIGVALATGDLGRALSVGLWLGLAAVLLVAGAAVARSLGRWVRRHEPTPAFTLEELREMRRRGEITEQEFAALRAEVLGRLAGSTPFAPSSDGPPDGPASGTDES